MRAHCDDCNLIIVYTRENGYLEACVNTTHELSPQQKLQLTIDVACESKETNGRAPHQIWFSHGD